jgi:hypothetical protein
MSYDLFIKNDHQVFLMHSNVTKCHILFILTDEQLKSFDFSIFKHKEKIPDSFLKAFNMSLIKKFDR